MTTKKNMIPGIDSYPHVMVIPVPAPHDNKNTDTKHTQERPAVPVLQMFPLHAMPFQIDLSLGHDNQFTYVMRGIKRNIMSNP